MRMTSVRAFILITAAMAMAVAAAAQEGHPLTGTWYGDYGSGAQKNDLTIIMKWDGRNVTGTVNPGPNASALSAVVMDITPGKPAVQGQNARPTTPATPPIYHVRFETDAPTAAGSKDHMVFDGTLQNPVAGNRRITGNWTRGNDKGTFQLRRQ